MRAVSLIVRNVKEKPLNEFSIDKNTAFGVAIYCKSCSKENKKKQYSKNKLGYKNSQLKSDFGITLEDYKDILLSQKGLCFICKSKPERKSLAVDHCHKTGKIRGLLCDKCNFALGLFDDNIDLLKEAIKYLSTTFNYYFESINGNFKSKRQRFDNNISSDQIARGETVDREKSDTKEVSISARSL